MTRDKASVPVPLSILLLYLVPAGPDTSSNPRKHLLIGRRRHPGERHDDISRPIAKLGSRQGLAKPSLDPVTHHSATDSAAGDDPYSRRAFAITKGHYNDVTDPSLVSGSIYTSEPSMPT